MSMYRTSKEGICVFLIQRIKKIYLVYHFSFTRSWRWSESSTIQDILRAMITWLDSAKVVFNKDQCNYCLSYVAWDVAACASGSSLGSNLHLSGSAVYACWGGCCDQLGTLVDKPHSSRAYLTPCFLQWREVIQLVQFIWCPRTDPYWRNLLIWLNSCTIY